MPRDRAIIAVFGGGRHVALAEALGAMLRHRGQVTLTGGVGGRDGQAGPVADRRVKDAAILGARPGPWVGVLPSGGPAFTEAGRGCVIATDLGHARNLLNAQLCDAAICLSAGAGTTSELLFCLALGRPVVLVGAWPDPRHRGDLDQMIATSTALIGAGPAEPPARSVWAHIVDAWRALEHLAPSSLPPIATWDPGADHAAAATAIVDRVSALAGDGRPGGFPDLEGYEEVRVRYDAWLAALERR